MPQKIMILNGAARKNGNTAKLIHAFAEGAQSAGHLVWYRSYEKNWGGKIEAKFLVRAK